MSVEKRRPRRFNDFLFWRLAITMKMVGNKNDYLILFKENTYDLEA